MAVYAVPRGIATAVAPPAQARRRSSPSMIRRPAMRIGLIAPPWIPVPPPAYGGTEEVIDNLARGLTALGHDVRLFTVGESTCPVPRQWLYRSPAEPMGASAPEAAHVLAAYQALAGDVDIIHDHTDLGPVLAGQHGMARQPVVTTIHGQVPPGTAAGWPRPPGTPRSWRSRTPMPAASGPSRWRRSSITASTWTSTSPAPGPAVTCCSPAGCPPTRACIARCGSPGGPAGRWSSRRRPASPPSAPTSRSRSGRCSGPMTTCWPSSRWPSGWT